MGPVSDEMGPKCLIRSGNSPKFDSFAVTIYWLECIVDCILDLYYRRSAIVTPRILDRFPVGYESLSALVRKRALLSCKMNWEGAGCSVFRTV